MRQSKYFEEYQSQNPTRTTIEESVRCYFGGGPGKPPAPPKPPAPSTAADALLSRKTLDASRKAQGFQSTILTSGLGDADPNSNIAVKKLLGN